MSNDHGNANDERGATRDADGTVYPNTIPLSPLQGTIVMTESDMIRSLEARCASLEARIVALEEMVTDGMVRILERVLTLEKRFPDGERNKSAAMKRDMTKDDAERVMKDPRASHQEVADEFGLSYAQVYSARLGYTFKDVARRLEKEGFKPLFARP